ncbi:hypothetical protein ABAC460_12795 [Asticcacaulis sp. AC460]|uniref:glycoside hydrolase family 9 protein n=1 Tax=Asticcacaulis sp. AC460 TaxID=1282360 RepID=UPI0003C3E13E|nr:glycoside hydrolase family 9 protein [Asticcacaulis sp. AC460]ESQ89382.1 hypothetical protein ABAC460_12795 [Asticcacaulis sp. AC460]
MSKFSSTAMNRRKLLMAAGAVVMPAVLAACGGGGGGGGSSGGGGGGGSSSTSSSTSSSSSSSSSTTVSAFIVVDQFGYLPTRAKIAVVRDPQTGFDSADSFNPGATYEVVNAATNAVVLTGTAVAWKSGATDASSGDKAWHFDFSSVTTVGDYFIRDNQRGDRSAQFRIATDVYAPVLRAAVRAFYYQRASTTKLAVHAGAGWADGLSHNGPLQDKNARLFSAPGDVSTERDLSGGWYDAGDLNRYTSWNASYVITLLHTYFENPGIWNVSYNIPESGNGLPDLLNEIKWGLDWMKRMQNSDGSVLSIIGVAHASPPSAATGQSLYGPANTSATRISAAAFALAAKVFSGVSGQSAYATDLLDRAEKAWTWCEANPNVQFRNNDAGYSSQGLGAGQQEVDDYGRLAYALSAAVYLYDATGKAAYNTWFNANYQQAHLFLWTYASPYENLVQASMLYYANLGSATSTTAANIRSTYVTAMNGSDNWGAVTAVTDPYLAHLGTYTWGSNNTKSNQGDMFAALAQFSLGTHTAAENLNAASHFIHYIHGVNPLGKCYLSNMATLGAENSVDQFFHTWFTDKSALWDSVKDSTYGPPPGFVVGGANPQYNWQSGCPGLNPACGTAAPSPPTGQPAQKSYKDFNDTWPLNSWEVTENSNGYQSAYIRLLARFVSV